MSHAVCGLYRRHCSPDSDPVAYIHCHEVFCIGCGLVVNGQLLHGTMLTPAYCPATSA
ncbi:ROK family protein [Izhakiella capsodis]|uniref:ROK family protein n=1 Tax=Izhakiella capsodis TaxID=1367852 RepID=UPI001160662F|nr:ROK family protein [Izhakiella capsodis]